MGQYLVFQLYGPMAAWGDIAVGEYRPSFAHPSKSAVVGLLAAAMGIRRDEEDRQRDLVDACLFAVRVDGMGVLLRDYHTIQVPSSGTGRNRRTFCTRKAELADSDLNTILSTRDYRCDACYTIAISVRDDSSFNIARIAEALRKPVFNLYLGRKSCVLAWPLAPKIIDAENVKDVLSQVSFSEELSCMLSQDSYAVYWEGDSAGYEREQVIFRRDMPLSRKRWQFMERSENFAMQRRREGNNVF